MARPIFVSAIPRPPPEPLELGHVLPYPHPMNEFAPEMSIGLEIVARAQGRSPAPLSAQVERTLVLADVERLQAGRGTEASPLKRITDRHHTLARLIASGMGKGEAGLVVNLSASRVSILSADPSFIELVEFYRSMENKEFRDTAAKLAGVTNDALDLIAERLEDDEQRDKISLTQAMEIVKLGADRTGFGPQATQTNVNIHVGLAEKMEAARKRARDALTIDLTPAVISE